MDEGVVECCQDVADTKHVIGLFTSTNNRGSVVDDFLVLSGTFFTLSTLCCCLSFLLSL
jgi:hypothetical protein